LNPESGNALTRLLLFVHVASESLYFSMKFKVGSNSDL